jgi:hypothetical protein
VSLIAAMVLRVGEAAPLAVKEPLRVVFIRYSFPRFSRENSALAATPSRRTTKRSQKCALAEGSR